MSKFKTLILSALTLVSVSAVAVDKNVNAYVEGSNSFGIKVFQNLAKTNENVLYSPISMNLALSMVGNFADAQSKKSLMKAMDYKAMSSKDFDQATKYLNEYFANNKTEEYSVNLANSFWVDKEFSMKRSQNVTQAKEAYRALVTNEYNFVETSTAAQMNKWVSEATQGRIKDLITAEELAPLDWAAINAVYFVGKWFSKMSGSYQRGFKKPDGNDSTAQYMEAAPGTGIYAVETEDAKIYEIAYGKLKDNQAAEQKGSMIIVQPKDVSKFAAAVKAMTVESFTNIVKSLNEQKELGNSPYISLNIPAFELSFNTDIVPVQEALVAAGAGEFFVGFDMTSLNDAFTAVQENKIKVIKQKANITVANEGTVAAAASFVGGGIESMGPQSVFVDSAFMYFIVDKETNTILFVGTLTDADVVKVPEMN